ncbi:MAG: DUF255 domain-containing protein [Gammaproteobacteria bacterium]|nr:DUF255 domain-containing protein [Gammaproteobacteria bacterium]
MRQLFKFVLFFPVISCLLLFSISGFTQTNPGAAQSDIIQWHEWSNETFALAEQQNKLVLLDISAQWCQFCQKMKAVTYKDPEVIDIINDNYIAINADIETTNDVQMLYGNLGVPGTVVLTANRDELNKRRGYIPPQQMQWHLLGSLQDLATENNPGQSH